MSIPSSVKSIGSDYKEGKITLQNNFLKGCRSLKHINFNCPLKFVENFSFYDCKSLEQVTIASTNISFDANAFKITSNIIENIRKKLFIKKNNSIYFSYKIEDENTDDTCELKVFFENLENYNNHDKRIILQTMFNMLNINHPLIQKGLEFYDNDHNFKLFTEYFKLDTLREIIDKNSIEFDETEQDDDIEQDFTQNNDINFDDTQKLMIIYGIASAMSYLHSRNIIHGDLNTLNILLDYKFCPKLVNYGIKSVFKEKRFRRNYFNKKFDCTSKIPHKYNINTKEYDIKSFALVVYEIVTGAKLAKPQEFFDDYEHYKTNLNYNILPNVYCSLIQKCLSSNPQTFDEIVHELKENPRFITDTIDEYEYRGFIKFIESSIREPELKNNNYEIIENNKKTIISFKNKNENKQPKYKVTNIKQIDPKKYKYEYKIGEGGFAKVILVTKKNENDKIYALKEFKKDEYIKIYDTNSEKYIFREIYYTCNFNYPAINKAIGYTPFDSIKDQDKIAILMNYKPKGSLDKEIEGMSDANKLIAIYGIAAGMSYIHSKNVIHRDLKAENILIDDDFEPLITDLGLAININEVDNETKVIGTPAFIAPEI